MHLCKTNDEYEITGNIQMFAELFMVWYFSTFPSLYTYLKQLFLNLL